MWTIRNIVLDLFKPSLPGFWTALTMIAVLLFVLFSRKFVFLNNLFRRYKKYPKTVHSLLINVLRVLFQWLEKLYKINICIKWLNTCVKLFFMIIILMMYTCYSLSCIQLQSMRAPTQVSQFGKRLDVQFSMFRARTFPLPDHTLSSLSCSFFVVCSSFILIEFLVILFFVTCDWWLVWRVSGSFCAKLTVFQHV